MNPLPASGGAPAFDLRERRNLAILFLLLLTAVLIRLPFYSASVIDWDESTFILMGQSLLDGHLPYVQLWDNKPPLTFAFFALTLLFGKSIFAVRLAGTLCVFLTAVLTWRIGERIWSRDAGLVAAILSIVFISLFSQATMTEIIAMVPVMAALLVLLSGTAEPRTLFLAGVLISIATLVRTNLAYLALAVGLVIVCIEARRGPRLLLRRAGTYVLGGLLPVALSFLPYVVTGHTRLFVDSVFIAPLSFVQSFADTNAASIFLRGFDRWNVLLWGGFIGGVVVVWAHWRTLAYPHRYQTIQVAVFLSSIVWSIVSTGSAYTHYLIQLVPFLALFAGISFSFLRRSVPTRILSIALLIGLAAPARPVFDEYVALAVRLAAHRPLRSDDGYRIAADIAANNPSREPIYAMTNHIVYWLLDMQPLAKSVTHPSTIGKEYLLRVFLGPTASSEGEMAAVLDRKPLFVVKTEHPWYLTGTAVTALDTVLQSNYTLVETIDGKLIYRRAEQ